MRYIRILKSREESDHFLEENISGYQKSPLTGRWAVHEKDGDRFVGTFAIIPFESSSFWQLGYALLKPFWGLGYATELTIAGIEYAFRTMMVSRLMAVVEISNEGSHRVLLKTGFNRKDNFNQDGKELSLYELYNKAVVETNRLLISALDRRQLDLYIRPDNSLEEELGLNAGDKVISAAVRRMFNELTIPAMRNATAQNYFFYTLWIVIDKEHNRLVGELGFKGEPNTRGEVEIGYGTFPAFYGQGIMTEAVAGIVSWAKETPGIKSITAETAADNQASIRVLQKNGFELINKHGVMLVWSRRLELITSD
jgi:ribosomal-protein-alanine N-acetyltransferase